MRRFERSSSPLFASLLACAALTAHCGGEDSTIFGTGLDAGASGPQSGSGGQGGGSGDDGGGAPSTGSGGDDASSPSSPSQADGGSVPSVPLDASSLPDAASCAIGSAGLFGLIPGGTMAPGTACVSCHASTGAKALAIGGTVYKEAHEPDQCLGVPSGVQVVVTDANGTDHALSVNSSGNFYELQVLPLATPYTAKVVGASGSVPMITKQTSTDCNSCHTTAGTQGAAGRIVGP